MTAWSSWATEGKSLEELAIYAAMMALLWGLGAWIVEKARFFQDLQAEQSQSQGHHRVIDGLRGYLALAVFVHHGDAQRSWYQTGDWTFSSPFFAALGPTGVMFFFMITAYLFWGKVIERKGRLDPFSLYRRRFLRLAPLYLFFATALLLVVALETRFRLHEAPASLAREAARNYALGLRTCEKINGLNTLPLDAQVTWTLQYEWKFYLMLPLLGILAYVVRPGVFLVLAWIGAVFMLTRGTDWRVCQDHPELARSMVRFLAGMTAAQLARAADWGDVCRRPWFGWLMVVLLAGCLWTAQGPFGFVCGAAAFLCFVYGADLFGLLTAKGSWLLGTVSYSIYLLHGLTLHATLSLVNRVVPVASLNDFQYWMIVACCGIAVVLISSATYRWVEHPWIGSRLSRGQATLPASARTAGGVGVT